MKKRDFIFTINPVSLEVLTRLKDLLNSFWNSEDRLDFWEDSHDQTPTELVGNELGWEDFYLEIPAITSNLTDVLIEVTIYGEDREDISRLFCLNGKSYLEKAKIIFPNFDKSRL